MQGPFFKHEKSQLNQKAAGPDLTAQQLWFTGNADSLQPPNFLSLREINPH